MTTVMNEAGQVFPVWSFGDRVRKARGISGLDQRGFAERIGASAGSVAQWETDRAKPRDVVAIAKRIEMLTHIPAAWVLGIDETPRPDDPNGGPRMMLPQLDSNQQPFGCEVVQLRIAA